MHALLDFITHDAALNYAQLNHAIITKLKGSQSTRI